MYDLPLEIVEADAVVVDDADLAYAGGGEIKQSGEPRPPAPTTSTLAFFSLCWPLAADLLQHQLALVALDLVRGEHDFYIYAIHSGTAIFGREGGIQ